MKIPLKFAENVEYTVEFRVVPALNHQIILGMPFLHQVNPTIDWKKHLIKWQHPQITPVAPPGAPHTYAAKTQNSQLTAICSSAQFAQAMRDAGPKAQIFAVRMRPVPAPSTHVVCRPDHPAYQHLVHRFSMQYPTADLQTCINHATASLS